MAFVDTIYTRIVDFFRINKPKEEVIDPLVEQIKKVNGFYYIPLVENASPCDLPNDCWTRYWTVVPKDCALDFINQRYDKVRFDNPETFRKRLGVHDAIHETYIKLDADGNPSKDGKWHYLLLGAMTTYKRFEVPLEPDGTTLMLDEGRPVATGGIY